MKSLLILLSIVALSFGQSIIVRNIVLTTSSEEGAGMDPSDGEGDTGRLFITMYNPNYATCSVDFGLPELIIEPGSNTTIRVKKNKVAAYKSFLGL